MKFLIQKIGGEIRHDFAYTLLDAIRFRNWFHTDKSFKCKKRFFNTLENQKSFIFKENLRDYVPVGSVEFVSAFLQQFYGLEPKPINVPHELTLPEFSCRTIFNANNKEIAEISENINLFVKSNDRIKTFSEFIETPLKNNIPEGNYQVSFYINIESEWRAFVYNRKLVGLQHYIGDFTLFPDVAQIKKMIDKYDSAPIAYTLDVGINQFGDKYRTFVIECHDFFSCGLYGFSNLAIYPQMLHKWFQEYINKSKNGNNN